MASHVNKEKSACHKLSSSAPRTKAVAAGHCQVTRGSGDEDRSSDRGRRPKQRARRLRFGAFGGFGLGLRGCAGLEELSQRRLLFQVLFLLHRKATLHATLRAR